MTFSALVNHLLGIINILVVFIFALTLVVITWKIIDAWIINGGESGKVEEGKKTIFHGILALVVMISVWGIVALLRAIIY